MAANLSPVVLCGPSGSGKSTFLKKLMEEYPGKFGFSVSHTTRGPRPGEVDGKDYHFVSVEEFSKIKSEAGFVENAQFSGNCYGTSKEAIDKVKQEGKICILDIDVQGVKLVKETDLNPRYIFIKPPSLETLEQRLRSRGTETEEAIQKRLASASAEMEYGGAPGNFNIIIENDDIETAYKKLKKYLFTL